MARVMHIFTVVRNNWKKTAVGVAALSYGAKYARNKFQTFEMMHDYCEEALTHGEETIPVSMKGRNITVILNPVANRRKAKKEFEKYCAPLLHLSGVSVTVIQTEMEGHARDVLETLPQDTDAIVVAGGDGTLSEVVTGLLRRNDADSFSQRVPIGILPLGRTNSVANQLFSPHLSHQPKMLAEATMAVVKGASQPMDVVKIELLESEGEIMKTTKKPVYSMAGLEWGPYRDAKSRRDKYWYWGPLRGYASYFFTAFKGENSQVTWSCQGAMEFTAPCRGCSNCIQYRYDLQPESNQAKSSRWWGVFMPRTPLSKASVDHTKIKNEDCNKRNLVELNHSEVAIRTSNVIKTQDEDDGLPEVLVSVGRPEVSMFGFIMEGWNRETGNQPKTQRSFNAKEVFLWPKELMESKETTETNKKDSQKWISIDSEDYEIKALRMTLYPKRVKIFLPRPTDRHNLNGTP